MKTLICDFDAATRARLNLAPERFDAVIGREDLEAAGPCLGCFGCWTRTPGRCVQQDTLADLGALLGATDELWIASRVSFGGYASLAKRALDRALPYLHPNFRIVGGQMHHRMRYPNRLRLKVWLYGPSTPEERTCATRIVRANAVNYGADLQGLWFPTSPDGVGQESDGAAPSDAQPAGRAPEPAARCPQRVALVNASPKAEKSATAHLLADLAEALGVYAGDAAPELVRAACSLDGTLRPAGALEDCDAVVVGYPLYVDALPSHLVALLEHLNSEHALAPGTSVYAVCNMGFYEPEQIEPSFAVLERFCQAAGLTWRGGVAVGGGGMVLSVAQTPRMGTLRRRTSEAIDQLIAALLAGAPVAAPGRCLKASCPLPRLAYRLAAEASWRQAARANGADLDDAPTWESSVPQTTEGKGTLQ